MPGLGFQEIVVLAGCVAVPVLAAVLVLVLVKASGGGRPNHRRENQDE